MEKPLAFLSYRRDDSRAWAALIADSLQRHFGRDAVFVDTETIGAGDEWPASITSALENATVYLPIIGPQWQSVHDENSRRRIDAPRDWVRREIEHGLRSRKPLIPVLVSGAAMPGGLPPSIAELSNRQSIKVVDTADIRSLVDFLTSRHGFRAVTGELDYPTPVDRQPELAASDLQQALLRLPEWTKTERDSAKGKGGIAIELLRVYKFKTFSDTIHFMMTTARYIRVTGHHPLWENQYVDLRVRLTTWDVGSRITWKDVRLAEYLDRQYREYVAYDRGGRTGKDEGHGAARPADVFHGPRSTDVRIDSGSKKGAPNKKKVRTSAS
jgi:pterin-4a-carbinolamine dehydratase